jgi:3-deoxy-7-phosphoheptulonate synthase
MATSSPSPAWAPSDWREYPALQQPEWPDAARLEEVRAQIARMPPLVFAGEARSLLDRLGDVAAGRAFLLQAGDCAESFHDLTAINIREKLKVILQMAAALTYAASLPVVKVGRMAGQFTKPRSQPTETVDGVELPSFRGHIVHGDEPNVSARVADPARMLQAYHHSTATLNLLRAFTKGGFADLRQVHVWNQEFVANSPEGRRYEQLATEIERALSFMTAVGVDMHTVGLHQVDVWTSHEALLLDYEEALTRRDSLTGLWYDCSAHFVWAGDRTRQPDGAHVHYLAGVNNPIGVKVGPGAEGSQILELCEILNPNRVPGRLTLIVRLGADRIFDLLPPLVRTVRDAKHPVVWVCDPMHGNTFLTEAGRKTRDFRHIMAEIEGFFAVHHAEGTWPGGVHLEITGDDVTECLGGGDNLLEEQLDTAYTTLCDPRLNARQSLDLAFRVAELMRGVRS